MTINRLRNRHNLAVSGKPAGTPYKESIRHGAQQHSRFKRQSGGHGPFPEAPEGRKWLTAPRPNYEPAVVCLVDADVEDFTQILLQVQPQSLPAPRTAERRAEVESAAA